MVGLGVRWTVDRTVLHGEPGESLELLVLFDFDFDDDGGGVKVSRWPGEGSCGLRRGDAHASPSVDCNIW